MVDAALERRRRKQRASRICGDYGHVARNKEAFGGPCLRSLKPGRTGCHWHMDDPPKFLPEEIQLGPQIEQRWGLPGSFDEQDFADPGEVLLAMITQMARRLAFYSSEIGRLSAVADQLTLPTRQAMILNALAGESPSGATVNSGFEEGELAAVLEPDYAVVPSGERVKIGHRVRALIDLEGQTRRELRALCKDALAHGIELRRVKSAEAQGANFAAVVRALVSRLHLTPDQMSLLPSALQAAVSQVFESDGTVVDAEIV